MHQTVYENNEVPILTALQRDIFGIYVTALHAEALTLRHASNTPRYTLQRIAYHDIPYRAHYSTVGIPSTMYHTQYDSMLNLVHPGLWSVLGYYNDTAEIQSAESRK